MSDNSLSETLHQLMHTYTNLLLEGIRQQGVDLSVTNIRTLKGICYNPKSTALSISKHMQRDKAQITRALNDLLAAELILKTDNPLDGRSQLLQLTPKGEAIMTKLDAAEEWAKGQLTQDLSPVDIALFFRVSRTMIDNVSINKTTDK
ncbi:MULTISPECIES: MarR family winged helix-turn-helix transcriptional regulator [unclassified Psychrobacter]|uniref:MarR family winged helix-turn-helix transcriptional regulator n=1 Tax=unclassified Psychrobacter TaxID=196806 RepID=UPI0025B4771B|nr:MULTISPECIES: MarR family winged helix-turn-helix transcriptional regulator [unclassified Psychrobacter]MDN3453523.1 MarR family winged helix-turn-helix transcriptional regulator [Psychrobacter sp. APC 3350]MDN3503148.1 MarR family winged helix-turn-helix transcriptional regulator [Psychrobacter sp. 5A.1]